MPSDSSDQPVSGVQFPRADGRRSTQHTARSVLAEATRAVAPEVAAAIESAHDWRKDYLRHLRAVEAAGVTSSKAALRIAGDGLAAVHREMVFVRDGEEVPVATALKRWSQPTFATAAVTGAGERPRTLSIPYRGQLLGGDGLSRQLDDWVTRGVIEASCAEAVREVAAHPDWLDASDLTVVLLGAGAEMGPLSALSRWGATVVAVDIARSAVWEHIVASARAGSGRLLAPARRPVDDADELAAVGGADLLTQTPEVLAFLAELDRPLVLGNYAYADAAAFVRIAVATDALAAELVEQRTHVSLAYLASPTDVFAVPLPIVSAARDGGGIRRRGRRLGAPLGAVTGQRLFTPNYQQVVDGDDGRQYGLADSVVAQQGPNYALAKRLQRWRAVQSRESVVTSANVAPATRTRSVVKNRVLAAAYAGAASYGVEIFEVPTSSTLMAALLVHDLRNPAAAAAPATTLEHPSDLFVDQAAHGGLWRLPWEPRSVLPLAAVEGMLRRRR